MWRDSRVCVESFNKQAVSPKGRADERTGRRAQSLWNAGMSVLNAGADAAGATRLLLDTQAEIGLPPDYSAFVLAAGAVSKTDKGHQVRRITASRLLKLLLGECRRRPGLLLDDTLHGELITVFSKMHGHSYTRCASLRSSPAAAAPCRHSPSTECSRCSAEAVMSSTTCAVRS